MTCELVTPGPVEKIGFFTVDECFNPVYGVDAGYIDDCASIGAIEPQTEDTRPEFLLACPNGNIRAYVPPRTVTKTTDAAFNVPWLPIEFLASAGAVTPVVFNGEVVGYSDCDEAIKLIVAVWQELLGNDACGGGDLGAPSIVTLYALRDVRFTETGTKGTSDARYVIAGKTVKANLGSGPLPLFFDSSEPDEPAWPDECIQVCVKGTPFKSAAPPEECGLITTEEPDTPCTPAS